MSQIPPGNPEKLLNAIIEIPIGSRIKYEFDKELNILRADRFLYTAFTYPFNYGYIPGTMEDDGDPLDVVVLSSEPIYPGVLVEVKLLGLLQTEDEEGTDAKLIAVPKPKIDPIYGLYDSINDLPEALKNKIKHFYETYKSIEPGKWVKVSGWQDKTQAIEKVLSGISRVQK